MNITPIIQAIHQRDAQRVAALLDKNTAALDDLLDDDLVYVHSTGVADTKASYLEGLVTGVWDYHKLSIRDQRQVVHPGTVLVFCRMAIEITVRGTFKSFESNTLLVWIQRPSGWRLAAVQSSSIAAA
ncbi:MAG: nuclear transport factor 2 family protein [Alphaproteobacteria bacterium]|nr:nuclear transport factor 2 family protein [Alphaproteobacteria bacterium]